MVDEFPIGGVGAEVGVWAGDFSALILDVARPVRLHLIDPWVVSERPEHRTAWYGTERGIDVEAVYEHVRDRFASRIAVGTVHIDRRPSHLALAELDDGALDFVYVDGDHRYDAVRQDLELAMHKVRAGGLIGVDDVVLGGWWGDGIVRAVEEVIGVHDVDVVFAEAGQVLLRRR